MRSPAMGPGRRRYAVLTAALIASTTATAHAGTRWTSVIGVKDNPGYRTILCLRVEVPDGADPDSVADDELRAFGAHRIGPLDMLGLKFVPGGFVWPQFFDVGKRDDVVRQYYNPAGDVTSGGALTALLQAQEMWSRVRTTRFRFEYGGTTARTPVGGDDFNDVGWAPPPPGSHFGAVTITNFSPETLRIIDSDVLINPSAPFTLDSLLSTVIHEEGHVLGLAHCDDRTSVMNVFTFPTVLGADDVEGVTYLYPRNPKKPLALRDPSSVYRFAGQLDAAAPSQKALWVDQFEPGGLSAQGEAAFVASLADRCLPDSDACYFAFGQGVYVRNARGVVTTIAETAQPAPGDPFARTFYLGTLGRAAINDKGDVAFAFDLDGVSLFPPFGIGAGTYRYDAKKAALEAIVTPSVTPAAGCESLPPGEPCTFAGSLEADINNGGDVAFVGVLPFETGFNGVFVAPAKGGLLKVVAPGDPAPSGVFDYASSPSINDGGDVAFDGHLAGEECAFEVDCASSVYLWHARTGHIEAIARRGAPAPGGGAFRFAINPVLNQQGDVLFAADLTPPPAVLEDVGLFLYSRDALTAVVRPGDPMPGGGKLVRASVKIGFGWPEYDLTENGTVAFSATLDTDSDDDGLLDTGVYRWEKGQLRLVARTGQIVPGEGLIAHVQPPFGVGAPQTFGGAVVNKDGHVLFQTTLTSGRDVLLVAEPPAVWPQITSVAPSTVDADGIARTVVISGSGLGKTTDVVVLPPSGVTATVESAEADSVAARVTVAPFSPGGPRELGLITTTATTNLLPLEVVAVGPHIDSVTPSSAAVGSTVELVVRGTRLDTVVVMRMIPGDGITITDRRATATELRATLSVAPSAIPGVRRLALASDTGADEVPFTITPPPR